MWFSTAKVIRRVLRTCSRTQPLAFRLQSASHVKLHNGEFVCRTWILARSVAVVIAAAASGCRDSSIECDADTGEEDSGKFDAARWAATLDRIKSGIVSLKVNSVRTFDTQRAGAGQATGFVVDAEKGLILTNRHVVTEGPVIAEALFDNHDEVELRAIYRDPVHDFGIFQYSPAKLQHTVAELQLRPDKAKQGLDVRIIGNNAGEKLSVLGAMLARLDREAPQYPRGSYADFNTFYFQAASGTSGGSSGSPVVDADGDVVALNAAGKTGTSASFYLPLDRAKRAVDLLRAGQPVPRGTLQATFVFTPFSELKRLSLSSSQATATRSAGEDVGMLVVKSVVPQGPVSGLLQPGDVLISVAGICVTRFTPLESIIDSMVGKDVELVIERCGVQLRKIAHVQDLHRISPHEYLECGDAVFNNLSYQQARAYNLPVEGLGVYVASQGYMLRHADIPGGSLILQVGTRLTRNVKELEAALATFPDGTSVPMHYTNVANVAHRSVAMVRIDRTWFPMQLVSRDDPGLGTWRARPSPSPPATLSGDESGCAGFVGGQTRYAPGINLVEKTLTQSIVKISVSVPFAIDGMQCVEFVGTGMVIDAERGLVVCDRNTSPGALCDCLLTFGSSCTVPGKCVYVHPSHNLTVLSYDTKLVENAAVKAVTLKRCSAHELSGKKLWHVTLTGSMRSGFKLVSDQATASESDPGPTPVTTPPRWQETNIDLLTLRGGAPMSNSHDGIIATDDGEVVAYWASFLTQAVGRNGHLQDTSYFAGITSDTLQDMLEELRQDTLPVTYSLGAEMEKLSLAAVRGMLMDSEMTEEVEAKCKLWPPQVMSVRRRAVGTDAYEVLADNDIVLEINGRRLETFRDIELSVRSQPQATLLVVRSGKKLLLKVQTEPLDDNITDRVVLWCGAVLQKPPPAVATQRGQARCGVYVASRFHGSPVSPVSKQGLPPMSRVVEVDGKEVTDLDSFLKVVADKQDGENVRIRHLDLRGASSVTCLRVDSKYWPAAEIKRVPGPPIPGVLQPYQWCRTEVHSTASRAA